MNLIEGSQVQGLGYDVLFNIHESLSAMHSTMIPWLKNIHVQEDKSKFVKIVMLL